MSAVLRLRYTDVKSRCGSRAGVASPPRIDAEPHVNEHTAGRRRFPVVGAELARPCRPSAYCVWHYIRSYFFTRSMRRLFERRERNEPALAIGARTTGHRAREDQIERCNLPLA